MLLIYITVVCENS